MWFRRRILPSTWFNLRYSLYRVLSSIPLLSLSLDLLFIFELQQAIYPWTGLNSMRSTSTNLSRTSKWCRTCSNQKRLIRSEELLFHSCRKEPTCKLITAYPSGKIGEMQDAVSLVYAWDARTWDMTRLIRDNLEFLQWMKRFWDSNYGGQGYDAVARRKGAPADPPATIAPLSTGRNSSSGSNSLGVGPRSGGRTPLGNRAGSTQPSEAVHQLQNQLKEMQTHLEGLEKERDFYFSKVSRTNYRFSSILTAITSYETSKF